MTILYAAYKQLQWLYADWVDGIRVKTADPSSEQRVAPLRHGLRNTSSGLRHMLRHGEVAKRWPKQ